MPLIQAIILAVVQGLTEFLPVSSTAHLVLFPWLLHWPDPGEAFDVALHAGTLVAVLLYFFKDWLTLTLCGLGMSYPKAAPPEEVAQHRRLFWFMVIGTIPGAILGKLFDKQIEEHLRLPGIIGVSMVVIALVMWWADSRGRHTRKIEQSTMGDAVAIGTAQALALWPGVSRSGITITAGLFRRFTREAATRFSFLLSAPLIAGAVVSKTPAPDQAAQGRQSRYAALNPGDQRRGFRHRRLLRNCFFSALSQNTDAESIHCLPRGVWYHYSGFGISSGGPAVAPPCPSPLSLPQMLRRTRAHPDPNRE